MSQLSHLLAAQDWPEMQMMLEQAYVWAARTKMQSLNAELPKRLNYWQRSAIGRSEAAKRRFRQAVERALSDENRRKFGRFTWREIHGLHGVIRNYDRERRAALLREVADV